MNPLETIARRWRLIALVTVLCAAASTVAALVTPPSYRASSSLLLTLGREFMYRPEVGGLESRGMYRLNEMMNSEAEILESGHLARLVIDRIGIETLFPDTEDPRAEGALDAAVRKFASRTTVRSIEDSSILKVYFEHEDPVLAARTLDTLLEEFLVRHTELFGDSTSPFLEVHEQEATQRLEAATEALKQFKLSLGVVDLDHELQLLLTRSAALRVEQAGVDRRHGEIEIAMDALAVDDPERDEMALLTPLALGGPVDQALQERLRVKLLLQEHSVSYDPESRKLRGLRNELASVERYLLDSVQSERRALEQRARALDEEQRSVSDDIGRLSGAARELQTLERTVTSQQEILASTVARLADARLAKKLDDERLISVKVVDGAQVPTEPRGLSKLMRLVLGALAGLAFGIALVLSLDARADPS